MCFEGPPGRFHSDELRAVKFTKGRFNSPHRPRARLELMAKRLIERRAQRTRRKHPFSLTSRAIEVLQWVARGKSSWEIGEILQIKKRTVHEHVQTAVRKTGTANRIHAVATATRDRIVFADAKGLLGF